jgi:DNA modification methylase
MPENSVHCCVTSPPYFGLRDYGVDGQIGLEASPAEFIDEMVQVFREVWRVLRDDGTLWLNLGDSYATGGRGGGGAFMDDRRDGAWKGESKATGWRSAPAGLKHKDLIGIPWRVAFALQADGWTLRQDIIWSKPNPMPESVTDRCTKAHEYLFLLSKSPRYQFDSAAIKEPATKTGSPGHLKAGAGSYERVRQTPSRSGNKKRRAASEHGVPVSDDGITVGAVAGSVPWEGTERNKRSVWTVATRPFPDAHFATFPPDLIVDCIKAGCPPGGTVFDPFGGAGTTGLVADRLQRNAILIELNPEYAEIARRRISDDAPLLQEAAP